MNSDTEVKILVVDDREDNLLSIETILERDNYQIVKADSGKAALKILLNQHDFTLILMDVRMPGMSGIETAELIYQRDKLRHIPIIFITAFNQDEEGMFEGYRTGAVDFIYKPINPQLLRYKVGIFVELFRQRNQLMTQETELRNINASLASEVEERKASEQKVKLLNAQLVKNNQELHAINEELDRFAYVASHDLQEPLRKIMMFSDRIRNRLLGQADADVDNSLEKILVAATRMQRLIKDILQFSRSEYASSTFELVDLNQVVHEVLSDMEEEIQKREAQLHVSPLPQIMGSSSQLRQLFQNLITNSLKFCKRGSRPEIYIYGETMREDDFTELPEERLSSRYFKIYVKDNGIGFDMENADKIFAVFKRLHSYQEYEGTGIGLSICKKIVNKHNGVIRAEGRPNEGATFIITLPEALVETT
ncbi:response regulator [Nibrella saemangeumensis]|uniref:histidine kinase n=1 Tax=Nibrella saemangeumensis TaxID=1084526 RepID=A0ABP8NHL8_9BACT